MRVWRLLPQDAAAWREIRLEALATAPDAFGARLADWRDRPLEDFAARLAAVATFAAGDDTRPLAVAAWARDMDPADAGRGWLMSVYTRPEGRGRGAAQAAIEAVIADAAACGMTSLGLHVGLANAAARGLYARLGFRLGPKPAFINDSGIREIEMIRPL